MKQLLFINGTMGAGKTATCRELLRLLPPSVFLDGDWCWSMNPFIVNEETKQLVLRNISFMLNGFLGCSAYETIVFCWVMHRQEIIDTILKSLDLEGVKTKFFTLTLSPDALAERLAGDIAQGVRAPEVLEQSLARLPLYNDMATTKIDVSNCTPLAAAQKIISLV